MERCDVVVIGAGHNGLTCAAYLGQGRAAGEGRRAPPRRRRRGGHRGVPSGLPQLGRLLHGQPAQPEGHPRPRPAPAWPDDRRAPRPELPAAPGRALSPRRRGPHQGADREVQQPRRRALRRLRGGARAHRRRAARPCAAGAAERRRGLVGAQHRGAGARRRPSATGCGGCRCRSAARSSTCSRNPPPTISTAGSRPSRSRRSSASTRWSAITRARTRRAPPMCCSTTSSAR